MNEVTYPEGIDCVWIATDGNGHVGAFVTGGAGPIPETLLTDDSFPLEDVEERVCSMPRTSDARLLVQLKMPDDYIDMAERGLFVYDWSDVHRTTGDSINGYELIAVPASPAYVARMANEIGDILSTGIEMDNIAFSNTSVLDVRNHLRCREASPPG